MSPTAAEPSADLIDAAIMRQCAGTVRAHDLPGAAETADALTRMAAHLAGKPPGRAVTEEQARRLGLRGYQAGIAVATGELDTAWLAAVEDLMRLEHPTLDGLTRERFDAEARECHATISSLPPGELAALFGGLTHAREVSFPVRPRPDGVHAG